MKKNKQFVFVLALAVAVTICFLVVPLLINWLFKKTAFIPLFEAEWSAGDALGYVGGALAFIGTMFLGWISWKQNRDLQKKQDDMFIAENSCTVLINKMKFKRLNQKVTNLNEHSETIVTTDIQVTSFFAYESLECEVSLHQEKNSPVIVRVLSASIFTESESFIFKKYDEWFTMIAIGKNDSKFNLTFIMSPDDKRVIESEIKEKRHEIIFEAQMEFVSSQNVSTILKCRSSLKPLPCSDNFEYSSDENTTMCFWYGNHIIAPSTIKYRYQISEEKQNGQDEI